MYVKRSRHLWLLYERGRQNMSTLVITVEDIDEIIITYYNIFLLLMYIILHYNPNAS